MLPIMEPAHFRQRAITCQFRRSRKKGGSILNLKKKITNN